jgi:hypothetical protein
METIRGIIDHGTIRLVTPLPFPEGSEIEFEPRMVATASNAPPTELYRLLDQRFNSGQRDIAARHNEHQP